MNGKLSPVHYRLVIKFLEKNGYWEDRQKGGHKIFKNQFGKMIVVPCHSRDMIGVSLLLKILREGDFTRADFLSFK